MSSSYCADCDVYGDVRDAVCWMCGKPLKYAERTPVVNDSPQYVTPIGEPEVDSLLE